MPEENEEPQDRQAKFRVSTLDRLKTFGKMGDDYDAALDRLMDEVESLRAAAAKKKRG